MRKSLFQSKINNYEIIIVNDASKDKTFDILKNISLKKNIIIINNRNNLGLGGSVLKGYKFASGKYCMYVPGDNAHPKKGLYKILKKIDFNKNEIIIPFVKDNNSRHILRIFLSKFFTIFVNILFNLNIPYYNSLAVYPSKIIKKITNISGDFSFQAQLLIILIKKFNLKYQTVETILKENGKFYSNAIKIKNVLKVIFSIFKLRFNLLRYERK